MEPSTKFNMPLMVLGRRVEIALRTKSLGHAPVKAETTFAHGTSMNDERPAWIVTPGQTREHGVGQHVAQR